MFLASTDSNNFVPAHSEYGLSRTVTDAIGHRYGVECDWPSEIQKKFPQWASPDMHHQKVLMAQVPKTHQNPKRVCQLQVRVSPLDILFGKSSQGHIWKDSRSSIGVGHLPNIFIRAYYQLNNKEIWLANVSRTQSITECSLDLPRNAEENLFGRPCSAGVDVSERSNCTCQSFPWRRQYFLLSSRKTLQML